jgi:hypothetical protein
MVRVVLIAVVVVVRIVEARAEIVVDGGAPFTAPELRRLLAVRGGTVEDLVVRAVSPTAVELRTSGGIQRVELGMARGTAAARLVALQLVPLGDELRVDAVSSPSIAPAHGRSWALGIRGGGGRGTSGIDFALTAVRLEAVRGYGRWQWGIDAAWFHGLARTPDGMDPATADVWSARAVLGFAVGRIQIVGGPALAGYRVSGASPGVTGGVGGGVRVRIAGRSSWHVIAGADVDGFLHRIVVARDGVPFVATPRVAVTAALGVVWGSS